MKQRQGNRPTAVRVSDEALVRATLFGARMILRAELKGIRAHEQERKDLLAQWTKTELQEGVIPTPERIAELVELVEEHFSYQLSCDETPKSQLLSGADGWERKLLKQLNTVIDSWERIAPTMFDNGEWKKEGLSKADWGYRNVSQALGLARQVWSQDNGFSGLGIQPVSARQWAIEMAFCEALTGQTLTPLREQRRRGKPAGKPGQKRNRGRGRGRGAKPANA